MLCACRTAPLRVFIRGLAQVHQLESNANHILRSHPATCHVARVMVANPIRVARRHLHETSTASEAAPSASTLSANQGFDANSSTLAASTAAQPVAQRDGRRDKKGPATQKSKPDRRRAIDNSTVEGAKPKEKKSLYRKPADSDQVAPSEREPWAVQRAALKKKFPDGWNPRKRLSPDALAGIRALHQQFPDEYPTEVLAAKFEVSPEAIRRILRSKWTPSADEEVARQERWHRRGVSVWARYAELGMKPPRRWRDEPAVEEKLRNLGARRSGGTRARTAEEAERVVETSPARRIARNLI